jgi:hypothetical protein
MQLTIEFPRIPKCPFVNEVEEFNQHLVNLTIMNQQSQIKKNGCLYMISSLKNLKNIKKHVKRGDIVEVLDALCDIAYVSLGNGTMLHGLKDKIWPAYQEVQASQICQKACSTEDEAMLTLVR